MNERIEKLKERIKGTPLETEMGNFLEKVQAEVKSDMTMKMVEKVTNVIIDVKDILSRRDQGFRDLHAYLEFQREEIAKSSENNKGVLYEVIKELQRLSKVLVTTQKVSITNPSAIKFTKSEMKAAFIDALDTVEKLLVSQNEMPDNVTIGYDRNHNVNRIQEDYQSFTTVTTIEHDNLGNVIGWQTVKQ